MNSHLLKFRLEIISDISCDVFVNNEKITSLSRFEMKEIPLPMGDHLIQFISEKNPKYRIIKRVSLNEDTLLHVEFAKEMKSHPEWIDYSDLQDDYIIYARKHRILHKVLNITLIPAIYEIVNLEEYDWYMTQGDIFRGCDSTTYCIDEYFESRLLETRKIDGYFLKGLMCVAKDDKYGFINYYGEEVIPLIYDSAGDFWGELAKVKKGKKWGYIDSLGNVVVDFIYDSAANFHEGLARVVKNNQYGFIDSTGKEVIPCQYECAYDFKNGSAVVRSEKYGVINMIGELIYPMEIEAVIYEDDQHIIGCKGEYYGMINRDGCEESPFINSYFDIATKIYPPIDDCKTLDYVWREEDL